MSNPMQSDREVELRKFALDRAVATNGLAPTGNVVTAAKAFYAFLTGDGDS